MCLYTGDNFFANKIFKMLLIAVRNLTCWTLDGAPDTAPCASPEIGVQRFEAQKFFCFCIWIDNEARNRDGGWILSISGKNNAMQRHQGAKAFFEWFANLQEEHLQIFDSGVMSYPTRSVLPSPSYAFFCATGPHPRFALDKPGLRPYTTKDQSESRIICLLKTPYLPQSSPLILRRFLQWHIAAPRRHSWSVARDFGRPVQRS